MAWCWLHTFSVGAANGLGVDPWESCFKPPVEFALDLGNFRSPLQFADGQPVQNARQWRARRIEILQDWHRIMGPWPSLLAQPQMEILRTEKRGNCRQHRVRLEIALDQFAEGWLLIPEGNGPFPAVFVPYYEPETSIGLQKPLRDFAWQLAKRGFVTLSIGSPGGDARLPETGKANCQPLSFLAYVAANCHTALTQLPEVDPRRIGIVGHSYGGKWAMFGACLYEKYACGAWSDPGIVWDETRPNVNYWDVWYLGKDSKRTRQPGLPSTENPRTGAYKTLFETGHDLHELLAVMAPRPFLVSGGSEDPPQRWRALNHVIAVNQLLGYSNRVAMTSRPAHDPTPESNASIYQFFEHFLGTPPETSPPQSKSALENMALGRPYQLDPPPNYPHCTDPADHRQLTDGRLTQGYFWTQPGTVGWSACRPVIVTVDLGEAQPIRGVSLRAAAGVAGVEWPRAIDVLVSEEGRRFYPVGELISLSEKHHPVPRDGYAVHRFFTDELAARGRYVAFLVNVSGSFAFCDELEIFKGDPAWLKPPLPGEFVTDLKAFFRAGTVQTSMRRRIQEDLRAVRDRAREPSVRAEIRRELTDELAGIEKQLPALPRVSNENFRTVFPLNELHEQVFQAQAKLWRQPEGPLWHAWQAGLWDPLSITQAPPAQAHAEVHVALMQNEYRAGAFNLSYSGDSVASLTLNISGLPDSPNPSWIQVHQVDWTDTLSGVPVAAALPMAPRHDQGFEITVVPGLTRQVWLTFHPTQAPPGEYQGQIALSGDGIALQIPLAMHLYPLRFPAIPTLHLGGWDYTDSDRTYEITPQNRPAVIAHLREHYVDSPWARSSVMPPGRYDSNGIQTTDPDTQLFDQWLTRWPGSRQFCVFASVGQTFAGSALGAPVFEKKVAAWIQFWAQHLQSKGLRPEQLVLLLVDEPHEASQDAQILAWAQAIKAARTGVKIWEDPCHKDPSKASQEMMAACDVLCPQRPVFLTASSAVRDYYVARREQGTELAFYSCSGPGRLLDPYTYHRLQAWTCWEYGAQASYFWAFGDSGGGSSWNEYANPRPAYTPFFLDASSVTPGKHMEALREGAQDYEYLVMLRQRIQNAEESGGSPETIQKAKDVLSESVRTVCQASGVTAFRWHEPKDRDLADRIRLRILEAILSLR